MIFDGATGETRAPGVDLLPPSEWMLTRELVWGIKYDRPILLRRWSGSIPTSR